MQGYAPSLCRNSWMLEVIATWPATVLDFTAEGKDTLLARRIAGVAPIQFHPQSPRAVRASPLPAFLPFAVYFLPDSERIQDYSAWIGSCRVSPTIIAKAGTELTFDNLTLDNLKRVFLAKLGEMPEEIDPVSVNSMRAAISSWEPPPARGLGFQVFEHGSVRPNVAALRVAGFANLIAGPFENHQPEWRPYVEQVVRTASGILDERDVVGARTMQQIYRTPPDINLYAPSIIPSFFDLPVPSLLHSLEKRKFRLTRDILRTQSGYSFSIETEARHWAITAPNTQGEPGQPHPMFFFRAAEVNLGTAVMSLLASSEFSAVLRMPNDINRTSGTVRNFAEHYRSLAPHTRKRLLAFRQVQDRLNAAFPVEFKNILRRSKSGVRIVSDAHVEWLDLDGLPLMLRKTCSRIPVTPGNLFVSVAGAQQIIHLTPSDLRKVLIINALRPDDPVSGTFKGIFEVFEERWKGKLDITTVSVANEEELVSAINAFDGCLLVFDGHGTHEPNHAGMLLLQDTPVDVWALKPKLTRVPPIILLSACDTHAADRNHATTANGFLNLGARAVVASVFPIDARAAAILTARFLFRVSDYLDPAIGILGHAIRWSDFVSGMLRMQILTEFLRLLQKQGHIDSDQYRQVHVHGNFAINAELDEPFHHIFAELEKLGIERAVLGRAMESAVAHSNVISYVHIGRPETILIDNPERIKTLLEHLESESIPVSEEIKSDAEGSASSVFNTH